MFIDLHVHTTLGSWDSTLHPPELIKKAREIGLDGVCITEHGKRDTDALQKLREEHDFLILSGVEVSTDLGDILVFGMDDFDKGYMEANDLRELVVQTGGVMVAAHPFRRDFSPVGYGTFNPALSVDLQEVCSRPIFELVEAVEVANGGSLQEEVLFSFEVIEKLGLCGTGGSDAHTANSLGKCVTEFTMEIATEADIIEAIRKGACRPVDRRKHSSK